MFEGKKILAIIPARGGSKGIPRKNLVCIKGKPLLAYTIESAHSSCYIDRVILSSEDAEIIEVAKKFGCAVPFVRPIEFADDSASNFATVKHAISMSPGFDYVVLLQPTSPLRAATDIDACIEECFRALSKSCVSVTECAKSPYWTFFLDQEMKMRPVTNVKPGNAGRQELEKAYVLNGAVYVAEIDWLMLTSNFVGEDTVAHVMPQSRSIDIDTDFDLMVVEAYLERTAKNG